MPGMGYGYAIPTHVMPRALCIVSDNIVICSISKKNNYNVDAACSAHHRK